MELFWPGHAMVVYEHSSSEVSALSKQNGIKNEQGGKENPPQTRASTTLSKEETRSKQRGE
jgi:hypothetical protein